MSTAYQTSLYSGPQPAGNGHGIHKTQTHLHAVSGSISTWAANDTIAVGYLPAGAIVTGVTLKAAAQLDSNGSPTLALDVGIPGTAQLFKAAVTTVGHASGASADATVAAAGMLYKTAAKTEILVTVHTAAATADAGTLEVDVAFFVEDVAGSNP